MNHKYSFNILIAGVGGQGVFTASNVITRLCQLYGLPNNGTTYKGGAQRLGSVYSTVKIFNDSSCNPSLFSSEIGKGAVDLVIGLEPWEAIRYKHLFNPDTVLFVNKEISTLFIERYLSAPIGDPNEIIKLTGLKTFSKNYTREAITVFGDKKMCNYLMLHDVICNKYLPFDTDDFKRIFCEVVNISPEIINKMPSLNS